VVNPSTTEDRLAEVVVHGATAREGTMRYLSGTDMHAHNTFTNGDAVKPQTKKLEVREGSLMVSVPAACVAALTVQLN